MSANTPSSPVILKVLMMDSVSQATTSRPRRALQPPVRADQHAEARRVDERGPGQVDDDLLRARGDGRHHALLELRGGEQVDLAGDGHDVGDRVHAPVLDAELDGHMGFNVPGGAGFQSVPS